jgi:hypothetical protein
MLHVVSWHSVVSTLAASGVVSSRDDIVSWEELLHEGPVPGDVPREQLYAIRSDALARLGGWGEQDEIRHRFVGRARIVADRAPRERVLLWFDADLVDQLELLDLFDQLDRARARDVVLICLTEPSNGGQRHVEQLAPSQFQQLLERQQRVTSEQLALGRRAWEAFRSPDPRDLEELGGGLHESLPALAGALQQYFQEFPWTTDGLARSERLTLQILAEGATKVLELYRQHYERQDLPFVTLSTLFAQLSRLTAGPVPLIARTDGDGFFVGGVPANHQVLELTEAGRRVLAGELDAVAAHGIDRWLGGVHLASGDAIWRWDSEAERLARTG